MTPDNVLLIKPSAIGDVVHALPILNLMRRQWPKSRITWLVAKGCMGLLDGHPQLDEVIVFDRQLYGTGWKSRAATAALLGFLLSLRKKRFDLVVDLQGLLRSGMLTGATGARTRVGLGYAREGAWAFYNRRVAPREPRRHAIERYLDVAEELGLGRGPVEFVLNIRPEDRTRASALTGTTEYAVLVPGANWETKRWPADRFARLAVRLKAELSLPVIIIGGPADQQLATKIANHSINLSGQTSLRETTAILESAAVVIANDTGPMHIAAALGVPLVALFGPTSDVLTGPYGRPESVLRLKMPCSPCLSRHCVHRSCLTWLDESAVLQAVRRAMG